MGTSALEDGANENRPIWVCRPLQQVGPLFYGMSATEAQNALPELAVLSRFRASPHHTRPTSIQFGLRTAEPAVYAYFNDEDQLCCVALDAVCGPLVSLDGLRLTGLAPAVAERAVFDLADSVGHVVSYGPRGNPGIVGIGLVMRLQEAEKRALSRPVLVGHDWADRCTDDAEGRIPLCEWVGRQWHYPGYPDVWPTPDDEPLWGDWRPPF